MTPEQEKRFHSLQTPWCSYGLIRELYGVDLSKDQTLEAALRSWGHREEREVLKPGNQVHRHMFETFLQGMRLLPKKLAAAKLGMDEDSLARVEGALRPEGFLLTSSLSDRLADESRLRDVAQFFPDLSGNHFEDHNDYCKCLHESVLAKLNIQLRVPPSISQLLSLNA